MKYTRMTLVERQQLKRWKQDEKLSNAQIARRLGRSPSTMGREIKRNSGQRGYRPKQAQEKAGQRARRPGPRAWTQAMMSEVQEKMQTRQWTPEIISERARKEGRHFVCKESIYQWIYRQAREGGRLWEHLPRARRKRRRRCPRREGRGRGRIPFRRDIDERPKEVHKRKQAGHWEGDLVNGAPGSGHVVSMVERRTRYTLLGRVDSKDAGPVSTEMIRAARRVDKRLFKTLTLDNGKEFAAHLSIARESGADVYFAKPYHSWERGSNENVNGLIRRLYPKGSDFSSLGPQELRRMEEWLNTRPRKCLGWRTPEEQMELELERACAPPR
jgi:IS30 family transposase